MNIFNLLCWYLEINKNCFNIHVETWYLILEFYDMLKTWLHWTQSGPNRFYVKFCVQIEQGCFTDRGVQVWVYFSKKNFNYIDLGKPHIFHLEHDENILFNWSYKRDGILQHLSNFGSNRSRLFFLHTNSIYICIQKSFF